MGRSVITIAALVFAYRLIAHLPAAPPPALQAPGAQPPAPSVLSIDLAARLAGGTLRPVNREVTRLDGMPGAVHVSEKEGPGVVWVEGSDFGEGTIEVNVRGRDVQQQSFVGLGFHRKDDATYEAVYLRPFNFRTEDPARRQNAVQYISVPDYDWPRLRKEFPSEFEPGGRVRGADRLGAAPHRGEGPDSAGLCRRGAVAHARGAQARHARPRRHRPVDRQ